MPHNHSMSESMSLLSSTTDSEFVEPGSLRSISLDNLGLKTCPYSVTISALDLATTPFALERAQELKLDITQDTPTPLTTFLENYKPYRGSHSGLRAYETRILKPFIRAASRSESILIQHDGNLCRRRIIPDEVANPSLFILARSIQKIFGVLNLRRSLEALDLASSNPKVHIKFEQDCPIIWKNIFHENRRQLLRVFLMMLFIGVPVLSLLIGCLITVIAPSKAARFTSIDLVSLDRRLCGRVHPGVQPCKINPNPDVAGIGGRIALYMQIFLLAVLLTFSPHGALSASWALVFTSTAFALSALIATATSQLTLYHVILTAKMQGLPIMILTIVELFPPRQRGPYIFLLHLFRLVVSTTVLAWYSVVAPCFGSQPECNAYVVIYDRFSPKQAIDSARRVSSLALAILSFTVTFLRLVLFRRNFTLAFRSLFSDEARRKWHGLPPGSLYKRKNPDTWGNLCNWAIGGIFDNNSVPPFVKLKVRSAPKLSWEPPSLPYPVTATVTMVHSSPPPPNRLQILYRTVTLNVGNALRYPKVWRLMIALGIGGLLVHSIEATISSNVVNIGENEWTYGQVMAVIMTTVPVIQVMQLVGLVPSASC